MNSLRRNKLVFLAIAFLVAASFFLAYFHQHSDGLSFDHCSICQFIHQIVSLFIFASTALFCTARPGFLILESVRTPSFLTTTRLRNRAPPF